MIIKRNIDLLETLDFLAGHILDRMADADFSDADVEIQITDRDGNRWIHEAPGFAEKVSSRIQEIAGPLSKHNILRVETAIDEAIRKMDLAQDVFSREADASEYSAESLGYIDMAAQAFGFKR